MQATVFFHVLWPCVLWAHNTILAPMEDPVDIHKIKDRGGRRTLPDRRQRSSSEHFPERRSRRHRRSGNDRRSLQDQKIRKRKERRQTFRAKYPPDQK